MTDLTLQFKRGSTAQNANYTGLAGELTVDTTKNSLRLHNGSTVGGFEIGASTGSGGLAVTAIKTSAYTSVGNEIIRVDSATNAFTVTLPTTPTDGMLVTVVDVTGACGANSVTLTGSTKTVLGENTGVALDYAYATLELVYNSSTANWSSVNLPVAVNAGGYAISAIKTSDCVAAINTVNRLNSSGGSFTITLPTGISDGSMLYLNDVTGGCGTYAITLSGNGNSIAGIADGLILDISFVSLHLVYNAAATNWINLSTPVVLNGGTSGVVSASTKQFFFS